MRSVRLQFFVVRDNLDHPLPYFIVDMVTRQRQEFQSHVNVPLGVRGILLREDSHLEHHLLPDPKIGSLQVSQEFIDNGTCVGRIAHTVQQVQTLAANTDIPISERAKDNVLVFLDRIKGLCSGRKVDHGLQTQVSYVGLSRLDVFTQSCRDLHHEIVFGVHMDKQVDSLEKDCILRVVLLDVLRCVHSKIHDLLQRLADNLADMAVLCY